MGLYILLFVHITASSCSSQQIPQNVRGNILSPLLSMTEDRDEVNSLLKIRNLDFGLDSVSVCLCACLLVFFAFPGSKSSPFIFRQKFIQATTGISNSIL